MNYVLVPTWTCYFVSPWPCMHPSPSHRNGLFGPHSRCSPPASSASPKLLVLTWHASLEYKPQRVDKEPAVALETRNQCGAHACKTKHSSISTTRRTDAVAKLTACPSVPGFEKSPDGSTSEDATPASYHSSRVVLIYCR